jgi:thioesterase domain-containing protein
MSTARNEGSEELRRARLEARRDQLSAGQRQALEARLRGSAGPPVAAAPATCLVEITPAAGSARSPFFCVHPAGGDVLCFFPLARHLGGDQPFYGLQDPGLDADRDPFPTLEEMARFYVAAVRRVQPAGPYHLGGWSFGGLAAFEMARQLTAEGQKVALLAVVDTGPGVTVEDGERILAAPHLQGDDEPPCLLDVARYVEGLRGVSLGVNEDLLRDLAPEARLRELVERLRKAGVVRDGQDGLIQLRRLLRVYRANSRSYFAYRPVPYPGPITLFRAAGSELAVEVAGAGPDLGWGKLSPSPVEVERVPGGHITLLAEPHVGILARLLQASLGACEVTSDGRQPRESACDDAL